MTLKNLATTLIGLLPLAAGAQVYDNIPSEDNPWYEVNIVIFKQPAHLLQSEQWKPGDEVPRTLPNAMLSLDTESEEGSASKAKPPQNAQIKLLSENASEQGSSAASNMSSMAPFVSLQAKDEEFVKAVKSLTISPNYEILYQNSWLQPGFDESEALSVLIQAGQVHDGAYELEGTARLHVARYLHLKANLWLSEYVQQVEVLKPWWQDSENDSTANDEFTIRLGEHSEDTEVSTLASPDQKRQDPIPTSGTTKSPHLLSEFDQLDPNTAIEETITRYKSIRTGVMNESRRMRSGEIHYIDHPLFGMVVKVVPYELPSEETSDSAITE